MEKVFKVISTFSDSDTLKGLKRLNSSESDILYSFENDEKSTFLKFDGQKCHWENGDQMLGIIICNEQRIIDFIYVDKKVHEGFNGYTKVEDITEEILYSTHDTSIYGFMENDMIHTFHTWRNLFITKDDVLDKINKLGIESLTENDKLLLSDKELKHPILSKINESL